MAEIKHNTKTIVEETYVITVSREEADVLRALVGSCGGVLAGNPGTDEIGSLYHAFNQAGLTYSNAMFEVDGYYSLKETDNG